MKSEIRRKLQDKVKTLNSLTDAKWGRQYSESENDTEER